MSSTIMSLRCDDGTTIGVEVDEIDVLRRRAGSHGDGVTETEFARADINAVTKAGLRDRIASACEGAANAFSAALERTIAFHASALVGAVRHLGADSPQEFELAFSVKASGESSVAIAKAGGEAHYQVKLVWKGLREASTGSQPKAAPQP